MKMILKLSLMFSLAFVLSCQLQEPDDTATTLNTGNADFTHYVSVGNSLTAGYVSGALTEKFQRHSYPMLIATQAGVGATFAQPYLGYPGIGAYAAIGAGTIELVSLEPLTLTPASFATHSFNPLDPYFSADVKNYAAPYNNLGVPGAVTYDLLYATNAASSASTTNSFFDIILRNPAFGNTTVLQQAAVLTPTFMTCWIGNNDVLGYATSGGTSPAAPTPGATFNALYTGVITALVATGADIVVANIPDVTSIPYFTTIPFEVEVPGVATPVPVYISTGSGNRYATAADLILLPAKSVIGDVSGTYGPAGVPVGLHTSAPLPNSLVLDEAEVTTAKNAVADFNDKIETIAAANNIPVADMNGFLNEVSAEGYEIGGFTFTSSFLTGGLFSLDGVHPAPLGYGLVANKFIEVINAEFDATIPMVNIVDLMDELQPIEQAAIKDIKLDLMKVPQAFGGNSGF